MSRTGTSLLYQLLYGHPEIFFPPFRIQVACSKPLGFPLKNVAASNEEFAKLILAKTTTPRNLSKDVNWSNIDIKFLDKQGITFTDEMVSQLSTFPSYESSLSRSVKLIHSLLELQEPKQKKYYCLHDDHAYVLGAQLFDQNPCKILTTIRSPIDMLASKKNMLLFHLHETTNPQEHLMTEEALEKELARALFSWLIASYEYSMSKAYYPILFEHIKGRFRSEVMKGLCGFIGISFDPCLETDSNILPEKVACNELLYAGSSLRHLTKGKTSKTVGSGSFSLTDKERSFISNSFDFSWIDSVLQSSPESFYSSFDSFWEKGSFTDLPVLKKWFDWYLAGKNNQLFEDYSSYNYGGSNAESAF